MNKREAADYLEVSTRVIERYASQGRLSVRYIKGKTGKEAVFDKSEVESLKTELSKSLNLQRGQLLPFTPDSPERLASEHGGALAEVPKAFDGLAGIERFVMALESMGFQRQAPQPAPTLGPKIVLTLAEAQAVTGISRAILRDAIEQKQLPGKIIGRAWRVLRTDVEEFARNLIHSH